MAETTRLPSDKNLEYHLITFFEKLDSLRNAEIESGVRNSRPHLRVEIRSLDFWRAVISECLASFVYVFIVCGAAASAGVGASIASMLLATALASGCTMASLTQCFAHISGAHVNPAVTFAMGVTKNISVLRTILFMIAQCGGGIAGAALLYGVSVPGYQGNLSAAIGHSASIPPWERFGVELILTFVVVFAYFVSMDEERRWMTSPALTVGATYTACSFVSIPFLNPARSLGPSFVLNKWDNHWVFWIGPIFGGLISGLMYKFIFSPKKTKKPREVSDGESSSIHSDEDTYDDLDKPTVAQKFQSSTYNTYRATTNPTPSGYCTSLASNTLYVAPPTKQERVESLYGGTRSLYCKSPPLTRANLNRSQSVYTKSNTTLNRDVLLKSGPLVPAQSLYPMRLNQQSHMQNQNLQNQLQQRTESIYGTRGITSGTARNDTIRNDTLRNDSLRHDSLRNDTLPTERSDRERERESQRDRPPLYSARCNTLGAENPKYEENPKPARQSRPESMYGLMSSARRGQSAQSDDSSYSSYQSNTTVQRNPSNTTSNYVSSNNNSVFQNKSCSSTGNYGHRPELRQSPPTPNMPQSSSNTSSYHHTLPQHASGTNY